MAAQAGNAVHTVAPAAARDRAWVWTSVTALASAPVVLTLCVVMWRTPFPISEMVALLEDAASSAPSRFLDPAARSWYRPWFNLTWTALLKGTSSLDRALFWYRCLEVGSVFALMALVIWLLRPRTRLDAAAATFAVAVMAGMPGFRDNLEIPLLMTLIAMPFVLIVIGLLERDRRWWHGLVIVGLTAIAVGYKEQGLVLVPIVVVAWWMDAPGIGRATVVSIVLATIAYLIFRFASSGSWPTFVQDVGYGFSTLSPGQASDRFGRFPLVMYAYSATATVLNILFSEPTAGTFTVVKHVIDRDVTVREIADVLSSAALTVLTAWWSIQTLRRDAGRRWSRESRLVGTVVIAILASGALGFNYTRDRLAGMAVPLIAIAGFFAVRAAAEGAARASRPRMIATAAALLVLAGAWEARAVGTIEYAQLTASKNRREWIVDLQARRTEFAKRPVYLHFLNGLVEQGVQPPPPRAGSLAQAIWNGGPEEVYAEIQAGADPNAPVAFSHPDATGDRDVRVQPIVLAVARNNDNAVGALMSFGARLDLASNRNAICLARRTGHDDVAEMIVRAAAVAGDISCPTVANTQYPLLDFVEPR